MSTRVSIDQRRILELAADGKPVYGEQYDFYNSAPKDRTFFGRSSFITIRSLVKRSLLVEDGKAGYIITTLGQEALK